MSMAKLPPLSEDQVRAWADSRSFSRGQSYARSDAVVNPRIQGTTLKAECWGSADEPYRVEVTLSEGGIAFATCSCPVTLQCKHAVAVLLTWLNHPERFREEEDLRAALSRRSQEELVRIIFRIIDRYPDAAEIAALPLPGESAGRPTVNSDSIRRQVRNIVGHTPREWGASYAAAGEVGQLLRPADEYASAGDPANAAVVYAAVADTILEDYDQIYEEEGEYLAVVGQCAEGMAGCLSQTEDPDRRRSLLEALFRIWRWDINFGGAGISDDAEVAMVSDTTDEEKAMLAGWARALLPSVDTESFTSGWRKGAIGGFLLQLEAHTLDDEAFLRICRETGRSRDLVERLLALQRTDEATEAARQVASDYVLLGLADVFRGAGLEGVFAGLIRERIGHSRDTRLLDWLIDYEMRGQRFQAALDLARQLFAIRPSMEAYRTVRAPAQAIGAWDAQRAALLSALAQANEQDLLVHIFLDEGEIDLALEALAALKEQAWHHSYHTDLAVAQAAEASRPQAAIEVYLDVAKVLIEQRGRGSYAEAAVYLARVRDLLQRVGQPERWRALIAGIRDENRRLRALRDELDRAGL
jgi:uncharacterized Zn finger protein